MALDGLRWTCGAGRLRLHGRRRGPLNPVLEYGPSWAVFAGIVLGIGAGLGRHLFPRPAGPAEERIQRRAILTGRMAGLLLMVGMAAVFARQLIAFRDPFVPISEDVDLLLGTDWGSTWRWGSALAAGAALAFAAAGRGRGVRGLFFELGVVLVIVLGVFPALTGHASSGDPRWLTQAASTLHVWGAGLWIGGLGMLVLALGAADTDRHLALVRAFSPVAMVGVGLLVVTGAVASIQHVNSPAELVSTGWGRILSVKLLLVAGVLLLGGWNWRVVTPRIEAGSGIRRSATVELVLAHLALVATAVLTRTSPG